MSTTSRFPLVLLIGANSNIARAFEQACPEGGRIRRVVRTQSATRSGYDTHIVADYDDLPDRLFANVDVAINCVGIVDSRDERDFDRVNVLVPREIAAICKRTGVPAMIHMSSFSVYGTRTVIEKNTPMAATGLYGRSKARADTALMEMADATFAISLLRVPVIYGHNTTNKIAQLASLMVRLGGFVAPADDPMRSVLHMSQAARALWSLVSHRVNGVVVVAEPERFRLSLLANIIGRRTGRSPRIIRLPAALLELLRLPAPAIYTSLFTSSVVDDAANQFADLSLQPGLSDGIARQVDMIINAK